VLSALAADTRDPNGVHDIDIRDVATAQLLADVTEVDR
jgi:hypothetical protein